MVSIADILAEHKHREGPLLPILHDVQKAFGHVSEDAMREIASALNLTRAEVYGVVSFYHDFRKEAEDRPVLKLCRAEACKARGVEALVPIADNQSRIKVEAIYCLGLCAVGPSAMVGEKVYARLDGAKFKTLLEAM
jgi:formate dehydrogenase subunit gamma